MRRERLQNDSSTTLNGNIDASQTTITVNDGSVFPAEGDFRLLCETEIMLCTARSTNDLTVVRGREGTTGASHVDTTAIDLIVTEDAIERYLAASVPWHNQAPALRIYDTSGAPVGESAFTWVNQGASTATDRDESIILKAPAVTGANVRAKVINAPGTPYIVTAAFDMFHRGIDSGSAQQKAGLIFRESSSGELLLFHIQQMKETAGSTDTGMPQVAVDRYTSPTVFSINSFIQSWQLGRGGLFWLRMEDDGTDLNYSVSPNGIDWHEVFTEGRTAFMAGGPDQIGFGINVASTVTPVWQMLHHFSVS